MAKKKPKTRKTRKTRKSRFGRDALDWQERHSPTVEIAVDDPEATRKARCNLTRCRMSEAWRHNRLSGMQREAEKEMEYAYRSRTVGLGAAVSRYGQQRGGSTRADMGGELDQTWREWISEAARRRIMVDAAIDCFREPWTLGQVEQAHRMRRGKAFTNYCSALDVWCELRGWIRAAVVGSAPHVMPEGVGR